MADPSSRVSDLLDMVQGLIIYISIKTPSSFKAAANPELQRIFFSAILRSAAVWIDTVALDSFEHTKETARIRWMLAFPQVKVSVVVGTGRPELFSFEFTNVVSGPPGPRGPATVLSVHMSGSTGRRGNCKAGMVVLEIC